MSATLHRIEKTKNKILPVLKNYSVTRAGIFGSYSRGNFKKNSDIDLLIEIKKRILKEEIQIL